MLSDRCPVCPIYLSVTLLYCGQTVGRIKMPLGTEVGLGPGDIVLDGDPAPATERGTAPPLVGPCLLWPNGRPSQRLLSSCARLVYRRPCSELKRLRIRLSRRRRSHHQHAATIVVAQLYCDASYHTSPSTLMTSRRGHVTPRFPPPPPPLHYSARDRKVDAERRRLASLNVYSDLPTRLARQRDHSVPNVGADVMHCRRTSAQLPRTSRPSAPVVKCCATIYESCGLKDLE